MQTNDDDVTLIFVFPSKGSYYMLDELLSFPRGNFAKLEKICLRCITDIFGPFFFKEKTCQILIVSQCRVLQCKV